MTHVYPRHPPPPNKTFFENLQSKIKNNSSIFRVKKKLVSRELGRYVSTKHATVYLYFLSVLMAV